MLKASGMRSGGSSRRKAKPIKRKVMAKRVAAPRAVDGNWNVFGLVHGGKEGKAWQKGKMVVEYTRNQLKNIDMKAVKASIKANGAGAIMKIPNLPLSEKRKLIADINRGWF
jgi:hypothetical protein